MRFEKLNLNNLKSILEIEKESFQSEGWSEKLYIDEIIDENKYYIVCYENEQIIGFGGYAQILNEGHIMKIAVKEECRKKGVGTAILGNLIENGKKSGIDAFTLEVRAKNLPARQLYEKFNFKPVGIRKQYYPDKEDAYIYWLYL